MPVQCMHCAKPTCVYGCPVNATWKEPDGIVVIDYDKCIACRNCMVTCPYDARHFNWVEPEVPKAEVNPKVPLEEKAGVVEKCTFCVQRTRNGKTTACTEACPVGARKFGDLNDPGQRGLDPAQDAPRLATQGRDRERTDDLVRGVMTT